jgi:hypothetical protein
MARVKKAQPTLESVFFSTPEQRVMLLLLSEATTSFNMRAISSKLKGVRGLGGAEGINRILGELQTLGLVEYVDNNRAVRLRDDGSFVRIMKTVAAICDLENIQKLLEPISSKGILFGSRASGGACSDSAYELFVVSDTPEEVKKTASRHPLAKSLELVVVTPEDYSAIDRNDHTMAKKLCDGIVLWGSTW